MRHAYDVVDVRQGSCEGLVDVDASQVGEAEQTVIRVAYVVAHGPRIEDALVGQR
jgi:hypothetical protein